METYHGHVRTPADAVILFEACRLGLLPRVQRRLSEKERQNIKSGSVFVWDEREAGMRRWTDGKSWSASRVSGSFLTYREMEGKRGGSNAFAPPVSTMSVGRGEKSPNDSDEEGLDLEGPDGYRYKPDGLMKQSFSITTAMHQKLHLISYYARSHPSSQNLTQPSIDPALKHIRPVKGMYPDSTVHEQQNVPAVTRTPMLPAIPHHSPVSAYMTRPSAAHPVSYATPGPAYVWPLSPVSTPPTTMQVPQFVHSALPPPPPSAGVSSVYHPPPFPAVSMGCSPRVSLPQLDGLSSQPSSHRGSIESQMTLVHRSPQLSQPQIVQSHHGTPPLSLPLPPPVPQHDDRYSSPANSVRSRSPAQSDKWEVNPLRQSPGDMEMNGSPRGSSLEVQDIPCEKLGFGEDMRALRVLDRAFVA